MEFYEGHGGLRCPCLGLCAPLKVSHRLSGLIASMAPGHCLGALEMLQ